MNPSMGLGSASHPWLTHSRKRVVEEKAYEVPRFRGLRLP